ncbi:hypothetical protein [Pontibacillus litoralis]|uniref:Uncharacterized protein n=1 Tax=Pontibacillus litoralis JSM 072002 TaxID=1385512 RepID=A0A0A5G3S2_9BACI|nr:hypothetical protein [Pontibacillus litoralis]KGX85788.1 hypothetical protein N784_07955 [Pontibacillus litoralis JSM 072002]
MNNVETQEERIDRLELYVHLLRQLIIDQEEYSLWDWVMVNQLNNQQLHSIQQILKKSVLSLINDDYEIIPFEKLSKDLKEILEMTNFPADDDAVRLLLKKAAKMSAYKALQYYLD